MEKRIAVIWSVTGFVTGSLIAISMDALKRNHWLLICQSLAIGWLLVITAIAATPIERKANKGGRNGSTVAYWAMSILTLGFMAHKVVTTGSLDHKLSIVLFAGQTIYWLTMLYTRHKTSLVY